MPILKSSRLHDEMRREERSETEGTFQW